MLERILLKTFFGKTFLIKFHQRNVKSILTNYGKGKVYINDRAFPMSAIKTFNIGFFFHRKKKIISTIFLHLEITSIDRFSVLIAFPFLYNAFASILLYIVIYSG